MLKNCPQHDEQDMDGNVELALEHGVVYFLPNRNNYRANQSIMVLLPDILAICVHRAYCSKWFS